MLVRALAIATAIMAPFAAGRADGPPPSNPLPPSAAYCCEQPAIWTGLYIGMHIGGAWSNPSWGFPFDEAFNTAPGQNFSTSASGLLWGGHLGVNYQIRRFLVGAEVSYADNRLSNLATGPFPPAATDRFVFDAADLFTATGRIGIVHDQFLLYGKAGYASSLIELNAASAGGVTAHTSRREGGWTIGGGLESRMVSNIIFGLEYTYVSLGSDRFTTGTVGTSPVGPFNADIDDLHMHTFVARLSVLFGPHACCSEGLIGKY